MKTNLTIFSFLTACTAFGNYAFEKSLSEILTQALVVPHNSLSSIRFAGGCFSRPG